MEELRPCWFCRGEAQGACRCGRTFCREHTFQSYCLVCALGHGLFEREDVPEPVSDLIVLSLTVAAKDPYIVIPPGLQSAKAMPLDRVEKLVGTIIQMLSAEDTHTQRRAAGVLANTTNTWPTLDPSQLAQHRYGTGLFVTDQVRRWLLHVLKQSRTAATEPTALVILDKLRTADFRDLYPSIAEKLAMLVCANLGTRVSETFQALGEFYPTANYSSNERCELLVYEQYTNRQRGAGAAMERMYGPRLRYAPEMAKLLKKGVWHSSYDRFREWYPGEDEPF
ncbi:MAG TPA: hypothetical protein VGE45_19570 [Chloroflexia bacterium]